MDHSFRTRLEPKPSVLRLDHSKRIFCLGSCFATHIGGRLDDYFFTSMTNPGGILFHPLAIEASFLYALGQLEWTEESLTEWQGIWHSWDHHSMVSDPSKDLLKTRIESIHQDTAAFLEHADVCVITLGTAWVYERKATGKTVANCHKHPGDQFTKKLLSVEEVTSALTRTVNLIRIHRPDMQFLFTVSPVRHLKDGFRENQLSKSTLLLATHALVEAERETYYFPAYEYLMDDLRDYRYYHSDFVHPNEMAVDYIWDAFQQTFMSADTIKLIVQLERLRQAAHHRPFHPTSPAHQIFLTRQIEVLSAIQRQNPEIDLSQLESSFSKQLGTFSDR